MNVAVRTFLRYILPVTMIAILSIYLVSRTTGLLHYALPNLPPMPEASVDRVEIDRGSSHVVLRRNGNSWLIDGPNYPANPKIIEDMIRAAATLTITDLIAEEPTYNRYGLGQAESITATFLNGSRRLRVITIGKRAPTYSHTYVLIDDDPRVYQAIGNLTQAFPAQEQIFRDRSILDFETSDIAKISVTTTGVTSELIRDVLPTSAASPTWQNAKGEAVDSEKVQHALDRLARMQASRFVETLPVGTPVVEFHFRGRSQFHRLTIYEKTDNSHVASSSDVPGPFILLPTSLDRVFMSLNVEIQ